MGPVSEPILIVVAIAAFAALLWVTAIHAHYRAIYRYDDDDLDEARRDAARRSRSVVAGRTSEQLAPLIGEFAERFDPADARFLGAPVDFVVFDGLAGGALREVVLVEVKTGKSRLNGNERQVRAAIERGAVAYELIRL
jgi:predicted Holliday junction resolvase-like endonuclease